MATNTIGTLATTTLQGIQWYPGYQGTDATHATDFATVKNGVFYDNGQMVGSVFGGGSPDDGGAGNKIANILSSAVDASGWLTLPGGRGRVRLVPGDWVAIDNFGNLFPIPIRALPKTLTLANCTTVNNSPALVFPSSVLALGWQNGTHVTGTNIPANSVIGDLTANGLAANLYSAVTGLKINATGSASNITLTAGTFTHS